MAELFTRSWKTRKGESWCYWIDYYVDGKRIRKSLGTQKIKEAEAKKRRIERDVEDGCHLRKRGTVTFKEAFESYLEYLSEKGARLATRRGAESIGRAHLVPEFGSIRLVDFTTMRVQAFVNARAKTHRWSSVKTMRRIVYATLDHAIKRRWLVRNVLRDDPLELPLQRLERDVPEPTDEQVARLVASLDAGPPPGRQLHAFRNAAVIVPLAALALRRGEIAGLAWEDVDFERGVISIRRSQAQGEGLGPTKTPKSARPVPLPTSIRDLLWEHLQHQVFRRHVRLQDGRPTGLVLRNRSGKMFSVEQLSGSLWTTIMRHAGLVDAKGKALFSIQAMRRWCSSRLQHSGLALRDTANHLGHTRTQTTERFYTYSLDGQQIVTAVERLAEDLNLSRLTAALGPARGQLLLLPPPARPVEPEPVAPPPRPSAFELREEAARLRDQGVSYAEIGRRLGVTECTVKRWILERKADPAELPVWAERRARAIELYREGVRGEPLAAQVGACSATIYRWLREAGEWLGPAPHPRTAPARVREEALRLYAEGVPLEAIAARLGVCVNSVQNWRRAASVPSRRWG